MNLGTSAAVALELLRASVASLGSPSAPRLARRDGEPVAEVGPGELDEYYVFTSGGHSGEIRIHGPPSMRELMRIPVFNRESATGWGLTNESRRVLTEGGCCRDRDFLATRGGTYQNGDLHHPHMSQTDGTYDGRCHLRQRQGEHPRRRIRTDVMLRQDHRGARTPRRSTACAAEVPADRAMSSPTAISRGAQPNDGNGSSTTRRTTGPIFSASTAT